MKKLYAVAFVATLLMAMVSCNKDKDDNLSEGQFDPSFKIAKISQGSTTCQTWDWGTSKLSSISDVENGANYAFSYSGDNISHVAITHTNGDPSEEIIYTYQGSLLSRIEIVEGTTTLYSMDVMHDANDKISTLNLNVSDAYLIRIAKELAFGGKSSSAVAQVLSPAAVNALGAMGDVLMHSSAKDQKYSISNKHFTISYTWDGSNLSRETMTGNVTATATLSDVADAFDFGSYSSIITSLLGDDVEWPLSGSVDMTTTYTYDEGHNPFRNCWKDGLSADNLSANNLLTATTTGGAEAVITLELPTSVPIIGGMSYPYERTIPMDESHQYSYNYGKKKYPKSYTVDGRSYDIEYK